METQNYTEEELCNIWDQCKGELKKTVSSLHYETYIASLKLIEISKEIAHFTVPFDFCINLLETKYYNDIKNVLIEATKQYLTVAFHLEGEYSPSHQQIKNTESLNPVVENNTYKSNLNSKYTFDSFIIGNSNRMAYAAAVAISDSPGTAWAM